MAVKEGVTIKNAGAGALRAIKGKMQAQSRGKFGYDHSVSIQDPESPSGVRVLYLMKQDAYDLADALDVLLATEENEAEEAS